MENKAERLRANSKRYYDRHKEDVLLRMKERRASETPEEREKRLSKRREYYAKNSDKIKKAAAEKKARIKEMSAPQMRYRRTKDQLDEEKPIYNPDAFDLLELADEEENP